jgi:hypothetical protein
MTPHTAAPGGACAGVLAEKKAAYIHILIFSGALTHQSCAHPTSALSTAMSDASAPGAFDALPDALLRSELLPLLPLLEDRLRLSATSRRWRALLRTPALYRALAQRVSQHMLIFAHAASEAANTLAELSAECEAHFMHSAVIVTALVTVLPEQRALATAAQKHRAAETGDECAAAAAAAAAAAQESSDACDDALAAALQDVAAAAGGARVAAAALMRAASESVDAWRVMLETSEDGSAGIRVLVSTSVAAAAIACAAACVAPADGIAAATAALVASAERMVQYARRTGLARFIAEAEAMHLRLTQTHLHSTMALETASTTAQVATFLAAPAANLPAAAARAAAATAEEEEDGSHDSSSGAADTVAAQLAAMHA